jgi:hypothetical protein
MRVAFLLTRLPLSSFSGASIAKTGRVICRASDSIVAISVAWTGGPPYTEKPGCTQDNRFCMKDSVRRAAWCKRNRNSRQTAEASKEGRGGNSPSGEKAPSVTSP